MIYFDHNSTTTIAKPALEKMLLALELPLNSLSSHQMGRKASQMMEEARMEIKNLLNAHNYEVIFTASSTEATNTVFFGADVEKIIFSKIEHNSVYNCRPENKTIIEVEALKTGIIDINDLKNKLENLNTKNFLTSIMLANNETAAIQPVKEVAQLTHQKGGLVHCDIVQAVGKIAVDLEDLNVDFASISAHKISGPQGVGALLVRKGLDFKPLIFGAKQEKSKRAGTSNVAGNVAFGEACRLAGKKISIYAEVEKLRNYLESEIKKIANDDVLIICENSPRLPNTSYLATKNIDSQTQIIHFDLNNICISAGSACSSGTLSESRVLKAMQVPIEFSTSAIRISLGIENTKEEVDKFITVWKELYNRKKIN